MGFSDKKFEKILKKTKMWDAKSEHFWQTIHFS